MISITELTIYCNVCGESLKARILNDVWEIEPCSSCIANEYQAGYDEGYEKGCDDSGGEN